MSTLSDLEDGVRAWLVAVGDATGPLGSAGVIIADQAGPRPPLPYATIRVLAYDVQVHGDEDMIDAGYPPLWRARGRRTSTVQVDAYGPTAGSWTERAHLMLRSPDVRAQLAAAGPGGLGLAIRPAGPPSNLSALLDDETETRWQRDYTVDYTRVLDAAEGVPTTQLEVVLYDAHWSDREVDERVDLIPPGVPFAVLATVATAPLAGPSVAMMPLGSLG